MIDTRSLSLFDLFWLPNRSINFLKILIPSLERGTFLHWIKVPIRVIINLELESEHAPLLTFFWPNSIDVSYVTGLQCLRKSG